MSRKKVDKGKEFYYSLDKKQPKGEKIAELPNLAKLKLLVFINKRKQ